MATLIQSPKKKRGFRDFRPDKVKSGEQRKVKEKDQRGILRNRGYAFAGLKRVQRR